MSNKLFYQRYGNANDATLVLLHSGGMAGQEWKPQIEPLAKHFDLLIPDLPGHGQSLLTEGETLSISLMAESLVTMLRDLGITRAHICGSSMGGAVALWTTLHYPALVDKLVVYRIGYRKNSGVYEQTRAMANPEYWRRYGMYQWLSQLHSPQGGKRAWETVIADVSRVFHPRTSEHSHSLSDLASITAETLLIAGDRDPLIPLPELLEMLEHIPNAALWVMPNASHITASNTWRANAFTEEIMRFLR